MKGERLVAPESEEVLKNRRGERHIYQIARAPTGQSWKNSSKVRARKCAQWLSLKSKITCGFHSLLYFLYSPPQ